MTGASGAFGKAFLQHALESDLAHRVCCFSRSESRQAELKRTITDSRVRWFIGDVRDKDRLTRAMAGCDVVIHAAALKRIEVCEYDASECMKTNVIGTDNVIHAATDARVRKVVTLSSDKGSAPLGTYGASKLMAERLTIAAEQSRGRRGPHFACVRYGNVAGSTGSIIPIWRGLAPHTMSDGSVTRFWMSLTEAVSLVRWTLDHMVGGETVVPQLPAYRLADLATAMGITPTVTGLGAYEKKAEAMVSADEIGEFVKVAGRYIRGPLNWEAFAPEIPLAVTEAVTSDRAPRLTVDELRERLVVV